MENKSGILIFEGTAMLNSNIIYKMHTEETATLRLTFMLSIIDKLVSKYDPQCEYGTGEEKSWRSARGSHLPS